MKNKISTIWLGELGYESARYFIREKLHPLCKKGEGFLVFCCHPPTLTYGKNMSAIEKISIENAFKKHDLNIEFHNSDRGGKGTFHDQNQLMIYPVFDLEYISTGIKKFVENILGALVLGLGEIGIVAYTDRHLAGLWVNRDEPKKIASVGFRVINKCTDHGIALYVGELSTEFSRFSPCGVENLKLVSISEIINKSIKLETIVPVLSERIKAVFCEKFSS